MRALRVAMLIQDYLPIMGGAQRQLAMTAPRLIASGVDVQIFTRHYPGLPYYEMMQGVPVYRILSMGPKPVASLLYTLMTMQKLSAAKPDLIHAYNLFSPLTTALLYKKLSGTPVVVKVLRGGILGDVDRLRKRGGGWWRLAFLRRNVDAFITISREIDSELDAIGIDPGRRSYIPNGVDIDRFSPLNGSSKMALRLSLGLPQGPLVIYTGRLVPEKRINQLVTIWPFIRKEHPQASLLLLGSGPERQTIQQAQTPGVLLRGQVQDVAPYLQAADLFVLPSATEGLSNALLEAMSVGLPVLATRVGGARDVIAHKKNGWLVFPDQPEQLQSALLELLSQPQQAACFGGAARRTIEDHYALDKICQNLQELYGAVFSKARYGSSSGGLFEKSGRNL